MANVQAAYGHSDVFAPGVFDFYSTAYLLSGGTYSIAMQTALLVLNPAAACTVTATLPLNPPDGAFAEVSNPVGSAGTITATVSANTGDSVVGTAVSASSMTAGTKYQFRYSLNGDIAKGTNPRSWIRIT
jgi:hypothetical protein